MVIDNMRDSLRAWINGRGKIDKESVMEKMEQIEKNNIQSMTKICVDCHVSIQSCHCEWSTGYNEKEKYKKQTMTELCLDCCVPISVCGCEWSRVYVETLLRKQKTNTEIN